MTEPPSLAARSIAIGVDEQRQVSGLLLAPEGARACYVVAHGAGAGMTHPFMVAVANGLAERRIATVRYQFPYMEEGARRPDQPTVAQATVRAAVREAARLLPGLPLFAGGKSFGGRMSSQAQAASPMAGVKGLIILGFPLHPPDRPSADRARHLSGVRVPMLFLQGTRDKLAQSELLQPLIKQLGDRATLRLLQEADHSFHVPARSGRNDSDLMAEMLDALADWAERIMLRP